MQNLSNYSESPEDVLAAVVTVAGVLPHSSVPEVAFSSLQEIANRRSKIFTGKDWTSLVENVPSLSKADLLAWQDSLRHQPQKASNVVKDMLVVWKASGSGESGLRYLRQSSARMGVSAETVDEAIRICDAMDGF